MWKDSVMKKLEKSERQAKFLVGVCGVGKTTYADGFVIESNCNGKKYIKMGSEIYRLITKDDITRKYLVGSAVGKEITMDEAWVNNREAILKDFHDVIHSAVDAGENILVDRYIATAESRAVSLGIIKESNDYNYKTTAIIIHPPPEEEHVDRVLRRARKEKRWESLESMDGLEPIGKGEFDYIEHIGMPTSKAVFNEYQNPVKLSEAIKDAKNLGNGQINR